MRRIEYNENYFEKIDKPEKAYFLGLIFSDGCIEVEKRKRLTIKLHKKDVEILEKFKKSIEFEGNVWFSKKRNMCEISLSGNKLIEDLLKYGLIQNKTKNLKYPEIDHEIDFIRGYFDGDGCIRVKYDKRTNKKNGNFIIVSGCVNFLNELNIRMSKLLDIKLNKLYGPADKEYKYISWTGLSDLEKIYESFYKSDSVFLERKKQIFDEVYKLHKTKIKYRKCL